MENRIFVDFHYYGFSFSIRIYIEYKYKIKILLSIIINTYHLYSILHFEIIQEPQETNEPNEQQRFFILAWQG